MTKQNYNFLAIGRFFLDCPSCNGGGDPVIRFFETFEDLLAEVEDYEFERLYCAKTQEDLGIFTYKYGFHKVQRVTYDTDNFNWRADDTKKIVWDNLLNKATVEQLTESALSEDKLVREYAVKLLKEKNEDKNL